MDREQQPTRGQTRDATLKTTVTRTTADSSSRTPREIVEPDEPGRKPERDPRPAPTGTTAWPAGQKKNTSVTASCGASSA
jgi:hypothetical protein